MSLIDCVWQQDGGATVVLRSSSDDTANLGKEFECSLVAFSFESSQKAEFEQFVRDRAVKALAVKNGGGVLLFLLSALLSRGAEGVRSDMDVRESPLIGTISTDCGQLSTDFGPFSTEFGLRFGPGGHGYCQQELVNLLLVGRAHSNVFDGVVEMGDDNSLRGIPAVSDCGYLTLFEALNPAHIQVGLHYKQPKRPIFVVCSESHYSVLFATDADTGSLPGASEAGTFDIRYYDELGRQDEAVALTLTMVAETVAELEGRDAEREAEAAAAWKEKSVPPLELVLRTRWPAATVDWNGADPIL